MKPLYRSATVAALLAGSLSAQAVEQLPLRDFFRNPEKTVFRISPDGKTISFVQPYENRLNIFIQPVKGEAKRITAVKDRDIRQYFWKGNDRLVYLKDNGGDENFHLFSVDRDGKTTRDLTPFPKVRARIIDSLEDSDTDLLVGLNKRKPEIFDAYRLNTKTGALKLVAENPGNITHWLADHNGKLRAAISTDGVNSSVMTRADEKASWKTIATTSFKDTLEPVLFTFDNKALYAWSNVGRDKQALVVIDPETGKEKDIVSIHESADIIDFSWSHKRKTLTSTTYALAKKQKVLIDGPTEKVYHAMERTFADMEGDIVAVDKEEENYVVVIKNDRTRGSYHLYNAKDEKFKKLADVSPWLKSEQLAEMKPISYKSRDGLTIHGYLTLPVGKEAKNLPVVVNPHGGPWARDEWRFNPEVQWLANRGYAVLQMNFRGSTGYGKAFWQASFKQWGRTMQDDITDGVKWMIDQGIANPKKICIYGASYGGYATLAGLTYTPDLYACGVDYVGVSNLLTFLNTIPPYWKPFQEKQYEMVGHPVKDKAAMEAYSPALNADKIKAPLLVLQGAKDPRVNKAESDQMVEALKKRGVTVDYIVKDNEGHGFSNEENRFEAYEAMEKFFAKYLN